MATRTRKPARTPAEVNADIIAALDIMAEYRAIGVQFTRDEPRSSGKAECYSALRDEANPSAYVDIDTGRYGDSSDGSQDKEINLWQLAADLGRFPSWKAAREHYADKAGVTLANNNGRKPHKGNGSGPAEDWHAVLGFEDWTPGNLALLKSWCRLHKPGVTPEAVLANGGRIARYPIKENLPRGLVKVIVLPIYGPDLLGTADAPAEPCGWVAWNCNGSPLEVFAGKGEPPRHVKMKTVGLADGIIGKHGLEILASGGEVDCCWKVEGPTDMLAGWSKTPAERRDRVAWLSFAGGSKQANPWMAAPFANQVTYVIHDADETGEAGAAKACALLAPVAREVYNPKLPYAVVPKKGPDLRDFLNEGKQYDDLLSLLLWCEPVVKTAAVHPASQNSQAATDDSLLPNEAEDDPHRLANDYLQRNAWLDQWGATLRFWREEWHLWLGREYRHLSDVDLRSRITSSIKAEFDRINIDAITRMQETGADGELPEVRKVARSITSDTIAAMEGICSLPSDNEAPFWISGEGRWPASEVFATGSGLIHLASLVDAKSQSRDDFMLPATPNFFSPNAVHYSFPEDDPRKCPRPDRWFSFLESLWGDDHQSIALLQEWLGYCLLPDTRHGKILLLIGPKRSGKGTIARVLTKLVGELNVVNPRLSQFDKEYGLWPLVGKTVAIVSDARLSGRHNTAEIVETLLAISGEDQQTISRKYLSSITTRIRTRFTIISNELPALSDASGALASRCLLLQTTNSFIDREDKDLEEALYHELPGILVWAIQGWARLRDRGHFEQPEAGQELLDDLYALTSPIKSFIADACIVENDIECSTDEIFERWVSWCKEQGRKPGTKQIFGRDLRAAEPWIKIRQEWNGGKRNRAYVGIGVRTGGY